MVEVEAVPYRIDYYEGTHARGLGRMALYAIIDAEQPGRSNDYVTAIFFD